MREFYQPQYCICFVLQNMRVLASLIIRNTICIFCFVFHYRDRKFLNHLKPTQAFWRSSMRTIHRAERIDLINQLPHPMLMRHRMKQGDLLISYLILLMCRSMSESGKPTVLIDVLFSSILWMRRGMCASLRVT